MTVLTPNLTHSRCNLDLTSDHLAEIEKIHHLITSSPNFECWGEIEERYSKGDDVFVTYFFGDTSMQVNYTNVAWVGVFDESEEIISKAKAFSIFNLFALVESALKRV